jgi:hypothetical protein
MTCALGVTSVNDFIFKTGHYLPVLIEVVVPASIFWENALNYATTNLSLIISISAKVMILPYNLRPNL